MVLQKVTGRFLKGFSNAAIKRCNCNNKTQNRLYGTVSRLTPQEVTAILQANEFTKEFTGSSSVKYYDSNQLASNNPIEDTRSEAQCLLTKGLLLGVFDGHGGGACAQDLMQTGSIKEFQMEAALENAFVRLDNDLSNEALLNLHNKDSVRTLTVAMSGAVAAVAHIDGPHLHVAGVGDCQAVLGVLSENDVWSAKVMTKEHNSDNRAEVERILSEHPLQEKSTVIKMERLLGQLAPLRSLGDFQYKWNKMIMKQVVVPIFGENAIPPNYHTPPYLTAKPEVKYHRLTPRDKFLIIASDGLWDLISPLQAVRLVGEHISGKVTLNPLRLPRKNMKLSDINEMLLQRKEGLKKKPLDSNAATHLLRNALGGTEFGIDHGKLSQLLTLPSKVVRIFRDDITITVVYMDSEFLRHCPP
ncbi:PREDICTED: pyruvate dehydrogenase [acetyl-transferring]-phosphatase 1, mitochondrial isoform X2 [Polistes canadensis]|uniref:pyruvate dehydrogenase [acetyl-transferring]-phosphatase 1, mitochondrial isoform X2 n=1 Tax=Polistes canadensis TaxID=91411 RepID=UPI000718DD4D|nr:PREDICTED: pyruvate dehydrogenase [acetyl-transferring]-phosphatase 1, mitochondrial isoform X2 [Polistes canadensis]